MSDYSNLQYLEEVFSAMVEYEKGWMKAAKESVLFYTGGFGTGQWYKEDLQKLRSENRPPLQLNMVLPKVNTITGVERQNRTAFRARPQDIDDDGLAQIATALLFHLDENRHLQTLFSRVFKDGVITGRGWIDVSLEQGEFFESQVKIRRESWANVLLDPEAESPDVSTWQRLARTKFMPLSKLKKMYPDELSDIKKPEELMIDYGYQGEITEEYGSTYKDAPYEVSDMLYLDNYRKKVRVVEMWERDFEKEYFLMDGFTGKIVETPYKSNKQAKDSIEEMQAKIDRLPQGELPEEQYISVKAALQTELNGMTIINKIMPKTYMSMFVGAKLLVDKTPNPMRHNQFPLIPYFYLFEDTSEGMETFGLVENLKDPQREKDKRRSQALDIMNRSPRGGGVFAGNKVNADQMNQASQAGKWIGVPGFKGRIADFMQQWSVQHLSLVGTAVALEQQAEQDMTEISGVNQPLMGMASNSKESGLAAQVRVRQALMGLQEQLDSLDQTKLNVMDNALRLMQQYYTPGKINRILGKQNLDPEDMAVYEDTLARFMKDFEIMKFDLVLDETQSSPTLRALKAAQVSELIRQGYGSLLPLYLELADFEASSEVMDKVNEEVANQQMKVQLDTANEGQSQ